MADRIHIKDLLLRTVVGINEDERRARQDVLINIVLHVDTRVAGESDAIDDAANYRTITKRVIQLVENSEFYLVEKLAAEIARICLGDGRVEAADVLVEKPGALRFARSVGVEIHRSRADVLKQPNRAYISLGSNIEPEHHLREAVRLLAARCRLVSTSPVYETEAVRSTGQPNFLNAAALIETGLTAAGLKAEVLEPIERQLGRVHTEDKFAARTVDLDIALFNDEVIDLAGQRIPNPDIMQYAHVAVPLADLEPFKRHPETGQNMQDIVVGLPGRRIIRRTDIVVRLSQVTVQREMLE